MYLAVNLTKKKASFETFSGLFFNIHPHSKDNLRQ
jgi:hypothetical protein